MNVAGYVRVSTEEQASGGYSLAAQEEAIRAYAVAHGWDLVEVYSDAGRSGKSLKGREAVAAMLTDADAGRFERLIFWKLDRLARNLRNLLEVSDRMEKAGVGIVSIQESIDTGTASGRMMRNVIGSLAEFEREVIVERIKLGIRQKAHEGKIVGPLSLGYRRAIDGSLEPSEVAPLVAELFESYSSGGYSLRQLAEWARSKGLKSLAGNPIDRTSVRKILVNRVYVGDVTYHQRRGGDVVARDCHEPLISRDLFDRVQGLLTVRQRTPVRTWSGRGQPYPLTSVSYCLHCGSRMIGCQSNRARLRYMRCSTTARMGRKACAQPMVLAEKMEGQIRDYLAGMRLPLEYVEAVIEELRSRHSGGVAVAEEAANLRKQAERWKRLFVMGEIEEERYRRETGPIRRRLGELEVATHTFDVEEAFRLLRSSGELWEKGERSSQRELVVEVFEKIVVDNDQVIEIKPKAAYAPLFAIDREERFAGDLGVIWLPGLVSQSALKDTFPFRASTRQEHRLLVPSGSPLSA